MFPLQAGSVVASLIALVARPTAQDAAAEQRALAPALLVFHPPIRTGAERQVLRELLDALGSETRVAVHEDSTLAQWAGPEAGSEPRLQVYQAMRRAGASGTWTLRFLHAQGVVQLEGFDDHEGVRVQRGTKIRSLALEQLSEEHLVRLQETLLVVTRELANKRALCEVSRAAPHVETLAWPHFDDPPQPGFRWVFEDRGPRVSYVYETSSLEVAGLEAGDWLVSINGQEVSSPPRLGRNLGPLRAGDALVLSVLRGARSIELVGQVESSTELVPRWQKRLLGQPLPQLGTPIADGAMTPRALDGRVALLVVYAPAMPDTWESCAVLRWIRDHYPEEKLALLGVASSTNEQTLRTFLQEKRPGWPAVPDPSGQLTDALRVQRSPAFLLSDAHGVLRFLQLDEAHLRQAIDTLLGLKD